MKKNVMLGLVLILVAAPAFAGSTICSSEKIYYSNVRFDFGTPPPPNTVLGRVVIAYDGQVLLDETPIQGLRRLGAPPYRVNLEGTKSVLAEEGTPDNGARVFRQTGVVEKVEPLNPGRRTELGRETVLCRETWRLAP